MKNHEIGDKIKVKVLEKGKEKVKDVEIVEIADSKKMGIGLNILYDYELSDQINYSKNSSEMGSSGGFINALYIYSYLIDEDFITGRNIVGTGTIDELGTVGEIGGLKYKMKAAVKAKADIFFVPEGNCEEAKELKEKNKYEINMVCVSKFEDAIAYLKK